MRKLSTRGGWFFSAWCGLPAGCTALLLVACTPTAPVAASAGEVPTENTRRPSATSTEAIPSTLRSEGATRDPERDTTRIELIPRSAWGAKPVRGTPRPHTLARLTVHHSAQTAPDVHGAPARIRGFQAFHQAKGFPDIAYHYVVDRDGNIYEGRDVPTAGSTFTNYDPAGHFLALLDGNFEVQRPTTAQMDALAKLLAWASSSYHISTDTLGAHRDYAATACPGKNVLARLKDGGLRRDIEAILARGPVELVRLSDADGKARVAEITKLPH